MSAIVGTTYAVNVSGWLYVFEADNARQALSYAKAAASGASLLPSDVTPAHVHKASEAEIAWHRSMGGAS
jgi:hypothetical protein